MVPMLVIIVLLPETMLKEIPHSDYWGWCERLRWGQPTGRHIRKSFLREFNKQLSVATIAQVSATLDANSFDK